jgi:hypothetical protein
VNCESDSVVEVGERPRRDAAGPPVQVATWPESARYTVDHQTTAHTGKTLDGTSQRHGLLAAAEEVFMRPVTIVVALLLLASAFALLGQVVPVRFDDEESPLPLAISIDSFYMRQRAFYCAPGSGACAVNGWHVARCDSGDVAIGGGNHWKIASGDFGSGNNADTPWGTVGSAPTGWGSYVATQGEGSRHYVRVVCAKIAP